MVVGSCSQWHWARSVDLYKHSVSAVQSASYSAVLRWFAYLQVNREQLIYRVCTWSLQPPYQRRADTVNVCVLQIDTNPTVPWQYFFANRIVSLTSQITATICFSSGRSRNQRCCRCRCAVCRRREERDDRHASLARQSTWTLPYRGSIHCA